MYPMNIDMKVTVLASGDKICYDDYTPISIPIELRFKKYKNHGCFTYNALVYVTDTSSEYCSKCSHMISRFRFMEGNYDTLRKYSECITVYNYMLEEINYTIRDIELGIIKCGCWHYYPSRVTDGNCLLKFEYESHKRKYAHINKKQLPSSAFNNRTLYRLQNNNFMFATNKKDRNGDYVIKHNYKLILEELKNWRERFSQEHQFIAKVKKQLSHKINDDCLNKVFEFI